MGLDMYMMGVTNGILSKEDKNAGKVYDQSELELGYWRKYHSLHRYIVDEFADGEDVCQRIDLEKEELQQILESESAIDVEEMKRDVGDGEEFEWWLFAHNNTLSVLKKAIEWIGVDGDGWNSVYYQASW